MEGAEYVENVKNRERLIKEIEEYLGTGAKYDKLSHWSGGDRAKWSVNMVRGLCTDRSFVTKIRSLCNLQEKISKKELRRTGAEKLRGKSRTVHENLVNGKKLKNGVYQESGIGTIRNGLKSRNIIIETLESISKCMRKADIRRKYPPGKDAISNDVEDAKGISLADTPKGKPLRPLGLGEKAADDLVGVDVMLRVKTANKNIARLNSLKKFEYVDFVRLAQTRQLLYSLPGRYIHHSQVAREVPSILVDYVNERLDKLDEIEKERDKTAPIPAENKIISVAELTREVVEDENSFLQKIGKKKEFRELIMIRDTIDDLLR